MGAANVRVGVVMAGGSGERFWPMSTPARPKQLLKLTSPDETMLEEACNRLKPLFREENLIISTSKSIEEAVREACIVPADRVWAEPTKRNTLGALCWVVSNLMARGQREASVAVVTADHKIDEPDRFRGCVSAALDVAEDQKGICTIGIPPDRPETGYGYIEVGASGAVRAKDGRDVFPSLAFREKPSLETARDYLDAGNYLWNGGMFFFTVPTFLAELEQAQPAARHCVEAMVQALERKDTTTAMKAFEDLPNLSVDYAVMEHAKRVFTVRADFPWDDVGAWDALDRSLGGDANGNVLQGQVTAVDVRNSVVVNERNDVPIGLVAVQDLIVVVTDAGILVCPKNEAQRVKQIVTELGKRSQ